MDSAEITPCIRYILHNLDRNAWNSWSPGTWNPNVTLAEEKELQRLGYIKRRGGDYVVNEENCKLIIRTLAATQDKQQKTLFSFRGGQKGGEIR